MGEAKGLRGDSAGRAEGLRSTDRNFTNNSLGRHKKDKSLRKDTLGQHRTGRYFLVGLLVTDRGDGSERQGGNTDFSKLTWCWVM